MDYPPSWVYSSTGANFVKTMLRLGAERQELRVVADQFGRPTHAGGLARALLRCLVAADAGARGTFHYAGNRAMTWHAFAESVFAVAVKHGRKAPVVLPIASKDYPTPARRPTNSRLDCARITSQLGIHQHDFSDTLESCVAELLKGTS
jgi:dTDP-4-dehydrorhamnose reductase